MRHDCWAIWPDRGFLINPDPLISTKQALDGLIATDALEHIESIATDLPAPGCPPTRTSTGVSAAQHPRTPAVRFVRCRCGAAPQGSRNDGIVPCGGSSTLRQEIHSLFDIRGSKSSHPSSQLTQFVLGCTLVAHPFKGVQRGLADEVTHDVRAKSDEPFPLAQIR